MPVDIECDFHGALLCFTSGTVDNKAPELTVYTYLFWASAFMSFTL